MINSPVVLTSTDYVSDGFQFGANNSTQWMNLAGYNGDAGGVKQQLNLGAGKYFLTLFIGAVYNPGGKYGDKCAIRLSVNGAPLNRFSFIASRSGGKKQQWAKRSVAISFGSPNPVVAFSAERRSRGYGADCGIDGVVLKRN